MKLKPPPPTPGERFEELVFGPDQGGPDGAIGDIIDRFDPTAGDAARKRVREALSAGVDRRVIYAARYLRLAEAPALLRAHLAAGPDAATEILLCGSLLAWNRKDEGAVARIAHLIPRATPEVKGAAIMALELARLYAARHGAVVRAALEPCLLDADPLIRWRAYRALLGERGLQRLVVEPDLVEAALREGPDSADRAYRSWRASLTEAPAAGPALETFLEAVERLPSSVHPAACAHRREAILTFETREEELQRCPRCGQWTWQDYEYTYLVNGASEEGRPAEDLSYGEALARLRAFLGPEPVSWLVARPGRGHISA